jgi:hypothetical protein
VCGLVSSGGGFAPDVSTVGSGAGGGQDARWRGARVVNIEKMGVRKRGAGGNNRPLKAITVGQKGEGASSMWRHTVGGSRGGTPTDDSGLRPATTCVGGSGRGIQDRGWGANLWALRHSAGVEIRSNQVKTVQTHSNSIQIPFKIP